MNDRSRDILIDCIVTTGTNPTVMFIKNAIENGILSGQKAVLAVVALGYHMKTPTEELLQELIASLIK